MTVVLMDPLLIMLQRHEAANAAFDAAVAKLQCGDDDNHLFSASPETIHAINARRPPATTAARAIAALECVLNDPEWNPEDLCPEEDFQRHLIAAARDYIKRTA
jgi:hypothetical protein